jgi:hypothetical protein
MIDLLTAARAEALFTSDLSTESHPSCAEVTATIRRAIRTHGSSRSCATMLAGEYGEHPETALPPNALGTGRGPRRLRQAQKHQAYPMCWQLSTGRWPGPATP